MKIAFAIYNVFAIPLLYLIFRILAIFNSKVRRGVEGRANLFANLKKQLPLKKSRNTILIHAASMGEYEQVRPLITELKKKWEDAFVVLSLFSPSVYENLKPNHNADAVTYLPFDSVFAVRKFLDLIEPQAILIARHDIWPNLVWMAKRRGIKTVLVDASVHEGSMRHKPLIRDFNRAVFAGLDIICPISEQARQPMEKFLSPNQHTEVCGDTRFDQVVARAIEKPIEEIVPREFLDRDRTFVAGSTWPEDDDVIVRGFAEAKQKINDLKLILVPHEPGEAHLLLAESLCVELNLSFQRMSKFQNSGEAPDVLLVDRIGILANLYAAGCAAFVGGSFGPGVHSVIEAAAHQVPVLFGPKMRNSAEAIDMVAEGAGFVITNKSDAAKHLSIFFTDKVAIDNLSLKASEFVRKRTGASQKIISILEQELLLN